MKRNKRKRYINPMDFLELLFLPIIAIWQWIKERK